MYTLEPTGFSWAGYSAAGGNLLLHRTKWAAETEVIGPPAFWSFMSG